MSSLVKAPITYEPLFKNCKFVDYLEKYRWTEFSECGVKCPCTRSKTIHRNKNSLKFQHCKTKKHLEYVENMNNQPPPVKGDVLGDELVLALKDVKQMKIQLGKEHEALQLEKQRNQTIQSQLKYILIEKEEALAEVKQANDFIQNTCEKCAYWKKRKRNWKKNV